MHSALQLRLTVATLLAATAFMAHAQTTFEGPCSRANFAPPNCLDGVSASVTSLDSLRVTSQGQTARDRGAAADEQQATIRRVTGLAAGDMLGPGWAVWGSASFSNFESAVAIAPYEANQIGGRAGIDYLLTDRLLLGVAVGLDNTDTDTLYNGGGSDTDGYVIAPYAAYLINDYLSADLALGYMGLDTNQDRIDTQNGATLTSNFDADRVFGAVNLNALYLTGPWALGGRIGALAVGESQTGYTETGGPDFRTVADRNLDLGQFYFGGDVGYSFGEFEPYAIAFYRNDFKSDDGGGGGLPGDVGSTATGDDDEIQFGVGLRYFGEWLTGSFEWLRTEGRSKFQEDTFALTIRMEM